MTRDSDYGSQKPFYECFYESVIFGRGIGGNVQYFWNASSLPVLIVSSIVIIVGLISIVIREPKSIKFLLPISLVPLAPIVYFSTLQNHSSIHPFIVFRSLALAVSVLFTIAMVAIFSLAKSRRTDSIYD